MSKNIVLLFLILLVFTSKMMSQSVDFSWAKKIGGSNADRSFSVATDNLGNVYTTGLFNDTIDLDPNTGVSSSTTGGFFDIFIQKLDATGSLVWAKTMGGSKVDLGIAITVDNLGNVYTVGRFRDTVDFDPNIGVYNMFASNYPDIFIQKLDALGNLVWVKQIGGTASKSANSVKVDNSGNIFIAGSFEGTVDFDPGTGVSNLTANSSGYPDIFVQKLDALGDLVWVKQMGGAKYDAANSLALDSTGNVYVTGYYGNTVDFDPGIGVTNLTTAQTTGTTSYAAFVQKLSNGGNFIWAKSVGVSTSTLHSTEGREIVVDNLGYVYTTGKFVSTVDFDPSANTFNLTSSGSNDIYIQKLDSLGNLVWAKRMGSTSLDTGSSLAVDSASNVYTIGAYIGTVDFDPNLGTSYLVSSGGFDIFIQKLDSSGNFLWAKSMGGSGSDFGNSISVNSVGSIYTTGNFENTVDFNPNSGVYNLTSAGGDSDVFIQKLTQCYIDNSIDRITTCNSYTWTNGVTYTSSNNTATDIFVNTSGCDSIVTLDLTINATSFTTDVQSTCDSFIWTNGITYTNNNTTATDTFVNVLGCDSIVSLDLIINTVNPQITLTGNTLTTNIVGATYQWLNCTSNTLVAGAISQSFSPTINGDYAVVVTNNACTDTSSCINVVISSIEGVDRPLWVLEAYPIPTKEFLTIDLLDYDDLEVQVLDINSRIIINETYQATKKIILPVKALPVGVYFVYLISDQERKVIKMIKE